MLYFMIKPLARSFPNLQDLFFAVFKRLICQSRVNSCHLINGCISIINHLYTVGLSWSEVWPAGHVLHQGTRHVSLIKCDDPNYKIRPCTIVLGCGNTKNILRCCCKTRNWFEYSANITVCIRAWNDRCYYILNDTTSTGMVTYCITWNVLSGRISVRN